MQESTFKQFQKVYLQMHKYLFTLLKANKITQQEYGQASKSISADYLKVKQRFLEGDEEQSIEPSKKDKNEDRETGDEFTNYIKKLFNCR